MRICAKVCAQEFIFLVVCISTFSARGSTVQVENFVETCQILLQNLFWEVGSMDVCRMWCTLVFSGCSSLHYFPAKSTGAFVLSNF